MDDGYRSARYAMCARVIAILLCIATCLVSGTYALAEQVQVVTSNTAYADIARQIGGDAVVVSVIDSPWVAASSVRPKSIVLCGWARTDAPLRDAARRALPNTTLIELPRARARSTRLHRFAVVRYGVDIRARSDIRRSIDANPAKSRVAICRQSDPHAGRIGHHRPKDQGDCEGLCQFRGHCC